MNVQIQVILNDGVNEIWIWNAVTVVYGLRCSYFPKLIQCKFQTNQWYLSNCCLCDFPSYCLFIFSTYWNISHCLASVFQVMRSLALPCIISPMTPGLGSCSTWKTSMSWRNSEVWLWCFLHGFDIRLSFLTKLYFLPSLGFGIGSEILKKLSHVSFYQSSTFPFITAKFP